MLIKPKFVILLFAIAMMLTACSKNTLNSITDLETTDNKANEKTIYGHYIAENQAAPDLWLKYNEYTDSYIFEIYNNISAYVINGNYTFENEILTLNVDNTNDKSVQLVFIKKNKNSFEFDESKSVGIKELDYNFKDGFNYIFGSEWNLPSSNNIDISKIHFDDIVNRGTAKDIQGNYSVSDKNAKITLLYDDKTGAGQFELNSEITLKGEYTYEKGILTLIFDDYDKNYDSTTKRYIYFYSNENNRFVLVDFIEGVETSSLDFFRVNLGFNTFPLPELILE